MLLPSLHANLLKRLNRLPVAGVRNKLLGLIVAVLLPLMAMEGAGLFRGYEVGVSEEIQRRREFSWQVAAALANYFEELWAVEATLGHAVAGESLSSIGTERVAGLLRTARAAVPSARNILWLDSRGVVVASTEAASLGRDMSGSPYVKQLLSGSVKVVSDLISSFTDERAMFHVGLAIRHEGAPGGAVLVEPDLVKMATVLPLHWGGVGSSGLVDRNGRVVVQTGDSGVLFRDRAILYEGPVGQALSGVPSASKGFRGPPDYQSTRIGAAVPIEGLGWVAYSHVLASSIWRTTWVDTWADLHWFLPIALLAVLGTFFAGGKLARPLVALRLAAEEVSRGNLLARVGLAGHDELAAAAQAFDRMAERIQAAESGLQQARGELERRVEERTAELAAAYAELQDQAQRRLRAEDALRESERRLRSVFDRAVGFLGLMSPNGRVLEVNQTALDLLGMTREQALGRSLWEIHPGMAGARDEIRRAVAAAAGGALVRREIGLYSGRIKPATIDISLKAVPGEGGETVFIIVEGHDISAIKEAEEAVRQRDITEERDRAREHLLHIAAHELRNPMAAVKGILQLLQRRLASGQKPEGLTEMMSIMEHEVDRLSSILNELLDAFRVQEGRLPLNFEPVDLAQVLAAALEPFRVGAERHRFTVAAPTRMDGAQGSVPVRGDYRRLEEVVRNLLSNAVKYSPDGGDIRITLGAEGGWASLAVTDDGVGIPGDQLDRVFEPFFRASNLAGRDPGGLGLGLYICRDIVQRHGGRIWAESHEGGGGTTFHVELPLLADV